MLKAKPCAHCDGAHIGAGHVWIVIAGRMSQSQLDAIVQRHHRFGCSGFDGRRGVGAGPLTDSDRISHEATIAGVVDALENQGWSLVGPGIDPPAEEEEK